MKKQITPEQPNFILTHPEIFHCFKGSIQEFSQRLTHPRAEIQQALKEQDFLIIDNETGEIIKA